MFLNKKKEGFTIKESRFVYMGVLDTLKAGGELTKTAAKLLTLVLKKTIEGVNYALHAPNEIRKWVIRTYTKAKQRFKGWKETRNKEFPKNLKEYAYLDVFFDNPYDDKKMQANKYLSKFEKIPAGGLNLPQEAAKFHSRVAFLGYVATYKRNFHKPHLDEYKRINEEIIKIRKAQIARKKQRVALKSKLLRVEAKIAGGYRQDDPSFRGDNALGDDDPDLVRNQTRRKEILIELRKISSDIDYWVLWPTYTTRKINFPKGAKDKKGNLKYGNQFRVNSTKKRQVNLLDLRKKMEKDIGPILKKIKFYKVEAEKNSFWRDRSLELWQKSKKSSQMPKEYEKYKKYEKHINKQLSTHLKPLTPPFQQAPVVP